MFNKKHYTPILKWKHAELRALTDLDDESKKHMTPLLELVMPKSSNPYKDKERKMRKTPEEIFAEVVLKFKEKKIEEIPLEIRDSWGTTPIFVDVSLLYEAEYTTRLKMESLNKIISKGGDLGLNLIPVINLNDDRTIQATVSSLSKRYSKGFCLRITSSDLIDTKKINEKLDAYLSNFDLDKSTVDLLIDLKNINKDNGQYLVFLNLSQQIKDVKKWRNFIFASGAAPEDLSKCKFDEATLVPRLDWQGWLKYAYKGKIKRIPTFADYTIRNPIYKESNQFHPPTTSIRYTLENDWMVMKGKKLDYKLYLVNAKLLVENSGHFYGENFSAGDRFVAEKAKHYDKYFKNPKIKGTGGSEDWIYAGINHHLTLTVHQLSNLF